MSEELPIPCTPRPVDGKKAGLFLDDFLQAVSALEPSAAGPVQEILEDTGALALLRTVFANSPFLMRTLLRRPGLLSRVLGAPPRELMDVLLRRLEEAAPRAETRDALMQLLRLAKAETALLVAFADIHQQWSLEEVTGALSRFADCCLQETINWLFGEARRTGLLVSGSANSGLVVLAMGKYGAQELNYSSDIDFAVFYEPGRLKLKEGMEENAFFIQMTRDLVHILQERTQDGYVFRTDIRLRPDPGSTAVAVSIPAAEIYYEGRGQNWERAVFIKARPVAGDLDAGAQFLETLEPFIWRKHLDFAAIEDVHSMKRQIQAVNGHGQIIVPGHNIKLGRGGIREIEFFVQTQQLIAGGRDPELRGRQTVVMLDVLEKKGWVSSLAATEMKESYCFLRTLEHRLQMVGDEQTHTLPRQPEELERMAAFTGYENRAQFEAVVYAHLTRVQSHYAALFESAPSLGQEQGNLSFVGTDDDPDTLQTLARMGFAQPADISGQIRTWHTGRFVATRNPRSRERLTALMPVLLKALSQTADPDLAFNRFSEFLQGLPAGVQLFSMLHAHPYLLDLIANICGTAPRLAMHLSRTPAVLDAVLDPDFFSELPDSVALGSDIKERLGRESGYELTLDAARVWVREQKFRIGTRVLSGLVDARETGQAYAAIAGETVRALEPVALAEVSRRYGSMPGGAMAIVAMGNLGSRQMSAESDIDIIVIYDAQDPDALSDGDKPVLPPHYYTRITQQLINALTAPTSEGRLYEVDMRLRPSGKAGPVATRLSGFETYQRENAWTWEHMALTRARVLTGPAVLQNRIEKIIASVLRARRDREKTALDILEMRKKIRLEFPSDIVWELKHVRGGLIDIEFIAQFLQLVHAAQYPALLSPDTRTVLVRAGEVGVLSANDSDVLVQALDLVLNLSQAIRLCVPGVLDPEDAPAGLKTLLAKAGHAPDFTVIEAQLADIQNQVLERFHNIIRIQGA